MKTLLVWDCRVIYAATEHIYSLLLFYADFNGISGLTDKLYSSYATRLYEIQPARFILSPLVS